MVEASFSGHVNDTYHSDQQMTPVSWAPKLFAFPDLAFGDFCVGNVTGGDPEYSVILPRWATG